MKKVKWFNVNYPWKTRTKRSRTKYFIVIEKVLELIFWLGARLNYGSLLVQLNKLILLRNTKSSVELFLYLLDESFDDGELTGSQGLITNESCISTGNNFDFLPEPECGA